MPTMPTHPRRQACTDHVTTTQTLGMVLERLQAACARLQALDVFQTVECVLDTPREAWAPAHAVDVRVHVREKPRLRLNTGTFVGSQEGNLVRTFARGHCARA
jgi:outer membrane protein assembly factor BamA